MKKIDLYEISVIIFFILLPVIASTVNILINKSEIGPFSLIFKWFVFSGVGLRLLTAGLKQSINPSFTAKEIFKVNEENSFRIVREVGFANISLGMIGILSLPFPEFQLTAAVAGGIYFGLAGCLHLFSKMRRKDEMFAMVSDYFIFFILMILIVINYFKFV
ncbi:MULTISPECIES: DUF6790 family protein [Clostridium]|uniref:DUF6790 family protein n=1 Tax=Clostridium TaxID=1485 RepID=UPI0003F87984|nr:MULTISPECIES: DUF6790 family protein [Clostridium]MBN7573704.1 hypothetical protein [Clostridium beijerinckii]MBN7578882.1 hypothetical protein [Clostridium beijerinckii]MBN7583335.1 hypothetical protein [Clostridium beijerinckii]MBO0522095.1 hypothetical protein [Clostridium beijerinckii]MZK52661.1 hypothetical protein [Clostridium beijerinckii]